MHDWLLWIYLIKAVLIINHKHYAEFWKKQGRRVFDDYLKRIEEDKKVIAAFAGC